MNPYPFALLNHFTTPFILSTKCPFSARPLSRGPRTCPQYLDAFSSARVSVSRECVKVRRAVGGAKLHATKTIYSATKPGGYEQPAARTARWLKITSCL